jgi:predicted RNA-binding Zn-ribbon protein involved in translation (DUF1610 family)
MDDARDYGKIQHKFDRLGKAYFWFFLTSIFVIFASVIFAAYFKINWAPILFSTIGLLFIIVLTGFYTYCSIWASKSLKAGKFNCPSCGTSRFYLSLFNPKGAQFPTIKGFALVHPTCPNCGNTIK